VAADLPVLTLQNGLATEDAVLRRFSEVYSATAWIAASHLSPGEVVSPSWPTIGIIWLGRHHSGTDERAEQIAADLRGARFAAAAVQDIAAWKAHKLRANITNGLDLFAGSVEELAETSALLVAELDDVFSAAGIDVVDPAAVVADLPTLEIGTVPGHEHRRSTWQSFARGAGSEVDHLNGEIVLLGRRHGVPTPVNEALQRALGARAAAGASTEPIDVRILLESVLQPTT
jgi:2-dehydropantoate 2-reductase